MAAMEKNNKTLNVPHLRFPEFSGEWEICKVSDILVFYSTNSLAWEQLEYGAYGLKNLHYGLIHNGLSTCVDTKDAILPVIKQNCIPKNYTECQNGDVAIADASEDTNDVAKCVEFIDCHADKVVCGLHTIHGRDKGDKTVVGFKGYAFSSQAFRHQIRRLAQGTKIYSISCKNFSECCIGIPSKEEQSKIARLLHLIDQRLKTQKKIIEKYESLIRGIVETHYSQCSSITQVKIAELGKPFTTMNLSKEDLSEDGNECVLYGELFTTYGCVIKEVKSKTHISTNKATISQSNDLLFPASTTVDAMSLIAPSAICKKDVILGGDLFGIHIYDDYNNEYLSYLINCIYKSKLARYAQGSTIIHLHYSDIKNVTLLLPSIEDQNYLAHLMRSIEAKINIEKDMLSELYRQKAYLLSNLFI